MRKFLTILIVAGPLIAAILGYLWVGGNDDAPPLNIPSTGPITIALAGDVLLTGPLGPIQRDPGFIAVRDLVRDAHFATANLEMNLLGAEEATKADARPAPRWPYGSALHAGALGQLGFDAMSLANDHAGDYGPDATASTIRILDKAGLLHAGTGFDLLEARAPVFAGPPGPRQGSALGVSKGRIAFISVAASSMPDARATPSRADIAGRPGLSPLRYTADITVDAATFQTLKESLTVLNGAPVPSELAGKRVEGPVPSEPVGKRVEGPVPSEPVGKRVEGPVPSEPVGKRVEGPVPSEPVGKRVEGPVPSEQAGKRGEGLRMFGTPIKKGDRTVVEFNVDQADERAVLEQITAARAAAEVVIVSVHSHEPANMSEEPAGFIRRFSRAAIDAGASLVVGHGPHRLRGIEVYGGGAILYSLGNFLYQTSHLDFRAANMFDAGADLYQAAKGALGAAPQIRSTPPDEPAWWEGVLAVASFDQGSLIEIRFLPLSLGADKPQQDRGMPRMAEGEQAAGILERLVRLSGTGDTRIHIESGVGVVRGTSPSPERP